jgi:hypothetical protein
MSTALTIPGGELALQPGSEEFERTATYMAREYAEATAEIVRLMGAIEQQGKRLQAALGRPEDSYNRFALSFEYNGHRHISSERPEDMLLEMKRRAWEVLIDRLGIKALMSIKKRNEVENQLKHGRELPEINEQAIMATIAGWISQAKDFAREAAREVFDMLRPANGWGGEYKTNQKVRFAVGRKVILTWYVDRHWNGKGYRPSYNREGQFMALDAVFHLLDGKGIIRQSRGPLWHAINDSPDGRGETEYFRFKCFKNGNLHLEMKRLDLVKELNGLAAGEYVIGEDMHG